MSSLTFLPSSVGWQVLSPHSLPLYASRAGSRGHLLRRKGIGVWLWIGCIHQAQGARPVANDQLGNSGQQIESQGDPKNPPDGAKVFHVPITTPVRFLVKLLAGGFFTSPVLLRNNKTASKSGGRLVQPAGATQGLAYRAQATGPAPALRSPGHAVPGRSASTHWT